MSSTASPTVAGPLSAEQQVWLEACPFGERRSITVCGVEFKVDRSSLPSIGMPYVPVGLGEVWCGGHHPYPGSSGDFVLPQTMVVCGGPLDQRGSATGGGLTS